MRKAFPLMLRRWWSAVKVIFLGKNWHGPARPAIRIQEKCASRVLQALGVSMLAIVMLGADGADARFNRVGHNMMCVCSCGQVLLECNHVGCPDSDRMIGELRAQMAGGGGDSAILNWFVQKYGATVLAAPIRGGFDTVAWVAPGVVFLLATIGTAVLVKSWTRRTRVASVAAGDPLSGAASDALRARIRRETGL